ncbi:MAG: peptidoglycan recognition protein family protein [Chitinophagaceae bacterium]|nr:peptidoglycan recognition protein family protein [Chitinophagaceae bacterium]
MTVHHEGTLMRISDHAPKKIKAIQTWGMGPDRKWADIPYHYLIAPDGIIYEGRDVYTAGETNTEYDPTGQLLICCMGNFNKQKVPRSQLDALIRLIAWCSPEYKISLDLLATHRDYSTQTLCPGKRLYRKFKTGFIKRKVMQIIKKVKRQQI